VEIAGSVGQKGCSQGKTHGWLRQEEKADMILCYCFHLFVVLYSTPVLVSIIAQSIIEDRSVRANTKKIHPESWILIYSRTNRPSAVKS
jgi:hypothetical protein